MKAMLVDMPCHGCGKPFYPAPLHIYRDGSKYFCSWHCYNAYCKGKEEKKKQRKGANDVAD